MVDILIKSFNRPYYLDRCLQSLANNVSGDYKVTVMDDGTPEVYLDKIREKHPSISIVKSKGYPEKIKAIAENLETGKAINGFRIPTDMWINQVNHASDYIIMTEDDVWFTQAVDLNVLTEDCKNFNINLLKLGWLGNNSDDIFIYAKNLTPQLQAIKPKKIFLAPPIVMDAYFNNKFKFYSILYKLGLVDNQSKRAYLTLNSILMGFYKKDYWLEVWKGLDLKVDEKRQIINATNYYMHHRGNQNFIARLNQEAMKTTFKSSATGSYHEYGNSFDVNRFNFIMNEFWLNDEFDSLENYPKDFSDAYIKQKLESANHPDAPYSEWYNWAEKFRQQYRNIGCTVE